ncbi:hypothetical protein [Pontibacillus salipaludis]|uniref:Lipoprotein n=1 Tax=Pontibacillus salipaludis TaxID=1697394 RepID=A0ABQ1Q2E8_9BACI|nr:hypothetical protein [Pontibacillus salipaludis]GGD10015.1 hypothetical protein GCM10011389_16930 [Pontibacillus salipaludis]
MLIKKVLVYIGLLVMVVACSQLDVLHKGNGIPHHKDVQSQLVESVHAQQGGSEDDNTSNSPTVLN